MRCALAFADHLFDGRHALTARHDAIDQAHAEQLLGGVQIAFEHDFLRQLRTDALAHERVGAHPREQVEQHLGQSHHYAFLGDDGVATQCRFETAAERVALHQGDAVRARTEADMECVHTAYTALGVIKQSSTVAFANELAEQGQIAAQVEHVAVGCQHHVRGQHAGVVQSLTKVALVAGDVVDQARRKAGTPRVDGEVGMHMDPVHVTLRFFNDA